MQTALNCRQFASLLYPCTAVAYGRPSDNCLFAVNDEGLCVCVRRTQAQAINFNEKHLHFDFRKAQGERKNTRKVLGQGGVWRMCGCGCCLCKCSEHSYPNRLFIELLHSLALSLCPCLATLSSHLSRLPSHCDYIRNCYMAASLL